MDGISVVVDSSGLTAAIQERIKFMDRTVVEQTVASAFFISLRAKQLMPVTPIGRIDTELAVEVVPVMGKRGKPLKRKHLSGGLGTSRTPHEAVPLVALIVAARAKPGSDYNATTGGRYAIAKNPFKGVSRAEGARDMAAYVNKMIKSRHSSTHFLQIGWNPAIAALKSSPHLLAKYRRPGPPTSTARSGSKFDSVDDEMGSAIIELFGDSCIVTIENALGGSGKNAKSHREALLRVGLPGLQQAVDEETYKMQDRILQETAKADAAFNKLAA